MNTLFHAGTRPYLRCIAVVIATLVLAACSGGSSSGAAATSTFSITDANSGVALAPDATLFGLSKIAISDIDVAAAQVTFNTGQNSTQSLIPDVANPGKFWLPVVLAPTDGTLTVSAPEGAPFTMAITLMPLKTSGAPGTDTHAFLQSSLSTSNSALNDLRRSVPLPDLLQALQAATDLTQSALTWVDSSARDGESTIARRNDGRPVRLSTKDLQVLDQIVLYTEASRKQGETVQAVAQLPWIRLMDYLIPRAFAQTTDNAAFISGAQATGDALGLTAGLGLKGTGMVTSAFYPNADAQVVSLTMHALYAAHYGNALATLQALPNLRFQKPMGQVQVAVGELFAGAINEITEIDMAELADDAAIQPVKDFTRLIDRPEVENILMDILAIFQTRSIGISLCPVGENAVADPEIESARCQ